MFISKYHGICNGDLTKHCISYESNQVTVSVGDISVMFEAYKYIRIYSPKHSSGANVCHESGVSRSIDSI